MPPKILAADVRQTRGNSVSIGPRHAAFTMGDERIYQKLRPYFPSNIEAVLGRKDGMRSIEGVVLFVCLTAVGTAPARSQADMVDLFGSLIRSGVGLATQAAWEKLPPSEIACVNRYLVRKGSSINAVVQQGIGPTDPRVFDARSECRDTAAIGRRGPSFDCARASMPDERAVCSDEESSQLDNVMASGYAYLKGKYGEQTARAVGTPLLRARQSCGADLACVKQAQRNAIRDYQLRGAPVAIPEARNVNALPARTVFTVDGLALGGKVAFESANYNEYRCGPSEQFDGFTWCQRGKTESSPRGQYSSSNSILHSADGTAFYVNRYLEPAFFAGNEANDDINRLSLKFGTPRIMSMPRQPDIPNGVIAVWGNIVLEPLDGGNVSQLSAGQDVRAGLLIDHIGNFRRSAQRGLPIYRIGGGAGYVWAASWNANGVGTLRFLTTDAAALAAGSGTTDKQAPTEQAPASPAVVITEPAPKPVSESAPVQAMPEPPKVTETSAIMQRIRETLKQITERRDSLPNPELKARLDDIASRLATANDKIEIAALRGFLRDCDAALTVFNEATDFKEVTVVASRKVESVEAALSKLSFDAPLVQEIKASLEAVKTAQSSGNVSSLRAALTKLNQTYDSEKLARLAEAKSQGFDSTDSYEEYKAHQATLSRSGIRLNSR